jgi:hypothetical protein
MGVEKGAHWLLIPSILFFGRQRLEERLIGPRPAAHGPEPAALFRRIDRHQPNQGRFATGDNDVLTVTRPLDQPR